MIGMVGNRIFKDTKITALFVIVVIGVSGISGALIGLSLSGIYTSDNPTINPPSNIGAESILPREFAEYFDYEHAINMSAPQYELDENLSNVLNLDKYLDDSYWTPEVQAQIQNNYFAAIPGATSQFADLYLDNYEELYPSFVTADSLLHAYHVIFDAVLQRCEENNFTTYIVNLTRHMVEVTQKQCDLFTATRWQQAALKNLAFFSVALNLLDSGWVPPVSVSVWVNKVISLMNSADGFNTGWFMGQNEDFSQYTPRGHYTQTSTLEAYFKALMWYGRIGFRLYPSDDWLTPQMNDERGMDETAQAILMTQALMENSSVFPQVGEANRTWASIYDTTSFFVGVSDDLTPYEYSKMIDLVYGENPSIALLQSEAYLRVFRNRTATCRNPEILSGYLMDTAGNVSVNTKGLRFMGQRYIPDSYILGQLVYKNVALPRTMPKGLDVMAAFGSERAWELLDDQKDVMNYTDQMMRLQTKYEYLSKSTWTQNLYWLWLYSFIPLLEGPQAGQPSFMLNSAWTDKQLATSLGTWTELRHDTILYGKQSYTYDYFGSSPTPPPGYVEPVPSLYARLASLCRMMIEGLGCRNVLDVDAYQKLVSLQQTLLSMQAISEKELQGISLNEIEVYTLKVIGRTLSGLEGFGSSGGRAELVADVHTDTINEEVLEEATGKPMLILVAVPNADGIPYIARGAMYSYYEFIKPMSERLTDQQWWGMVDSKNLPLMPNWMSSFVVDAIGGAYSTHLSSGETAQVTYGITGILIAPILECSHEKR
jgi:hypothetical protein